MRVFINLPEVKRSKDGAQQIRDALPADKLEDYLKRIVPAVLPVTFRLDNRGATIMFED